MLRSVSSRAWLNGHLLSSFLWLVLRIFGSSGLYGERLQRRESRLTLSPRKCSGFLASGRSWGNHLYVSDHLLGSYAAQLQRRELLYLHAGMLAPLTLRDTRSSIKSVISFGMRLAEAMKNSLQNRTQLQRYWSVTRHAGRNWP